MFGLIVAILTLCTASPVLADATVPTTDKKGSKDSSVLKRYAGSLIVAYEHKSFAEFTLPLSRLEQAAEKKDNRNNHYYEPNSKKALEGEYTRLVYLFNKVEIKPESDPTLEQIAKLLQESSALKLLVVGHTDNVGNFTFNMDLSQRRAAAVVNALATRYGIRKDRLTPVGVSFASPMASNKTDEGRAKNRRVELVEN